MAHATLSEQESRINKWFGNMVHQLRTHELQLVTGTASEELEDFYDKMMRGDDISLFHQSREASTKYFVKLILEMYINELKKREINVQKLALSTSDERILVWVQIADDDQSTEKALILAQARVNSAFHQYGFHIESMIVEECDNLKVPPHYHLLI
jgi:hypothetical protein